MRDTKRGRDTGTGRSRLPARSLMRTLGSHPEPKADTQPLSHLGIPKLLNLIHSIFNILE